MTRSSTSPRIAFIRGSSRMTASAASASCPTRASIARTSASWTELPRRMIASFTSRISRSSEGRSTCWGIGGAPVCAGASPAPGAPPNVGEPVRAAAGAASSSGSSCRMSLLISPPSAEPAGHVVLGELLPRIGEDLPRRAELHEIPGPVLVHGEEGGLVAHATRLLHVVGDDHDRVVLAELRDELLDPQRRDGVERRRRL